VTEPAYLDGFRRAARNTSVEVKSIGLGRDPLRVVQEAKARRREAEQQGRRDDDHSPPYDETWCVFDRDAHSRFDVACGMARDNGLMLAASDPCFELWLLLHFRDCHGRRERGEVQRLLREASGSTGKSIRFEMYAHRYVRARDRARQLETAAEHDGEPMRNPTTGFYRLTDSIARKGE